MKKENIKQKFFAVVLIVVGVWYFVWPIINSPEPIQIPKENTEETRYWKTYSNEEFRFSFKYPEGLLSNFSEDRIGKSTQKLLNRVSEIKKQNAKVTNPSYSYNVHFGADAWKYEGDLDMFLEENLKETKNLKRQKIILKDHKGIRINNKETKSDAYFIYNLFENGDFIYNFAIFSDDPVLIEGNRPLLEEIISTVKFY